MAIMINPYQAYRVRLANPLALLQIQALTYCYQPIIGASAVSLYLTLANHPHQADSWSYPQMHARLLQILNQGIQTLDNDRQKLEAVGLIKTFRDENSHESYQRQTIIYQVQMPLSMEQFFKHPQLSTALYHFLGDDFYYQLQKQFIEATDDLETFSEISQPFAAVFQFDNQRILNNPDYQRSLQDSYQDQFSTSETAKASTSTFDQDFFWQILSSQGIKETQITQAIWEEILTLAAFYQLAPDEMAKMVQLAQTREGDRISLTDLRTYCQRYAYRKKDLTSNQQAKDASAESAGAETSPDWSKLKAEYPQFQEADWDLLQLCYQIQPSEMLNHVKESCGGFATDQEHYYVKDLLNRSSLGPRVINLLIYYLIILEAQANFEKGRSSRIANEWQQQQLTTVEKALDYLIKQRQAKLVAQAQAPTNTYKTPAWKKQTGYRRQEPIPAWMQTDKQVKKSDHKDQVAVTDPELQAQEAALKARINQVLGRDPKQRGE